MQALTTPTARHSLELLQLAHQLCLLLRGHAGKDSALDQDLECREGRAEAALQSREQGKAGGLRGSPTLGNSLGKYFLRTPKVDPLSARWLDWGCGSIV